MLGVPRCLNVNLIKRKEKRYKVNSLDMLITFTLVLYLFCDCLRNIIIVVGCCKRCFEFAVVKKRESHIITIMMVF